MTSQIYVWPYHSCMFYEGAYIKTTAPGQTDEVPVLRILASSLETVASSLMPHLFSENTLNLYVLPMIRSEIVAFSLW